MTAYANEKGIYTATSTNGHFITEKVAQEIIESGLKKLIISVDGSSQEIYEQYRINGNLSKVKKGILNLVDAKNKVGSKYPKIIMQCVALVDYIC